MKKSKFFKHIFCYFRLTDAYLSLIICIIIEDPRRQGVGDKIEKNELSAKNACKYDFFFSNKNMQVIF